MGSGASSPEVDAQVKKWENAVNDLSQLCNDQRKALGLPSRHRSKDSNKEKPIDGAGGPGERGISDDRENELRQSFRNRRTSSLVSFEREKLGQGQQHPDTMSDGLPSPKPQDKKNKTEHHHPASNHHPAHTEFSPQATSPTSRERNLARDQIVQIRKNRTDVFKSYEPEDGCVLDNIDGVHPCHHYAVIAAGLSALLGGGRAETDRKKKVTVEDLFFAAQIPLASLNSDIALLSEVYDVVREFLDVDNRFQNKYVAECVHLDIAPVVGQVEMEGNEVGDRQPRVSLPDFRKSIQTELEEDADSIRFLYYDPYIVHQAMTTEEDEGEEGKSESDGEALTVSITKKDSAQQKVHRENRGHLSAVVDFRNAVQPMITIAEAVASDKLYTHLHEVPLGALYKAMKAPQITGRAGGYIRVTLKRPNEHGVFTNSKEGEVPFFFCPELCSGKVLGSKSRGSDAHCKGELISRHIGAVGWALHLLAGSQAHNHNHGYGLPISQLIRQLQLPIDVFLRSNLSLDQVFVYITQYLEVTGMKAELKATLCPILTKNSRADAPPTLSIFDLESVLIDVKSVNTDPEAPSHIMIVQYDANIAHNVLNIAHKPQWCVLVGYDEDTQTARMIDANAVRFSLSWNISLDRLHKAITNYGYIILGKIGVPKLLQPQSLGASQSSRDGSPRLGANSSGDRTPAEQEQQDIGVLRHINSVLQARFDLLEGQASPFPIEEVFPHFVFPGEPFAVTQLAVALTKLGWFTTVETLLHKIPFDINALVNSPLSLLSMSLLAETYVHQVEGPSNGYLKAEVRCADRYSAFDKSLDLQQFVEILNTCTLPESNQAVLLNIDRENLHIFGTRTPYGEYILVLKFDPSTNIVTVADANPNRYFRTWRLDARTLLDAMYKSPGPFRARGALILHKVTEPVTGCMNETSTCQKRVCDLGSVPLQNLFALSPSPQIQALSIAFAQLGYFYSPEEIFYEAYLKTVNDQRRRGSQAFAWRDVEVSLSMVSKINADTTMKVARKFLESRKVGTIQAELMEDLGDEEELEELLTSESIFGPSANSLLLVNYRTEVVHKVQHFGPSMAIVMAYDPAAKKVGLFEAEHTRFGLEWSVDVETFIKAADLRNEGKTDYGVVKLSLESSPVHGGKKVGIGFNKVSAFGETSGSGILAAGGDSSDEKENSSSGSGLPPPPGGRPGRTHSPRAVFLEPQDGSS